MSVAVITGAATGIGAGLAREAAARGMTVILADIDEAPLCAVCDGIGAAACGHRLDVRDGAAMERFAEAVFAAHQSIDLLFNNAGVMTTGLSWEIAAADWQRSFDVNVGGIVNGIRAFVPRMLASGRPGRIVNTASVGGFLPAPLMAPYCATKFAVVALTEALAGELSIAGGQIAVSLLAPGPVRTGIFGEAPNGRARQFHAAMVEHLAQDGIAPDEFASRVFAAIDRNEYWIIPQPEAFDSGFAARNAAIASRHAPDFFKMEKMQ